MTSPSKAGEPSAKRDSAGFIKYEQGIRRESLASKLEGSTGRKGSVMSVTIPENSELSMPSETRFNLPPSETVQSPGVVSGKDAEVDHFRSFRKYTLDQLPRFDNYRISLRKGKSTRPTLLELHELENAYDTTKESDLRKLSSTGTADQPIIVEGNKFGWLYGVLMRNVLNIFGVMLFLRVTWVAGQAGVGLGSIMVIMSTIVTIITTLSLSAICTNGKVLGGGVYYMISRSLGPEWGGAMGLIFSIANAVGCAINVVGFAEAIRDILKNTNHLMVDEINDVRIISIITIVALLTITMIGLEWEMKAQFLFLLMLIVGVTSFYIGAFFPQNDDQRSKGFVGWHPEVLRANFGPDYRNGNNFYLVLSIFFPAVVGIHAGATISGDLKDPATAVPKGTIVGIVITSGVYLTMMWWAGFCVVRDAPGPIIISFVAANATSGNFTLNGTESGSAGTTRSIYPVNASTNLADYGKSCYPNCIYGLANDVNVSQLIAAYGPLTIVGIIAACLSSALGYLVYAAKVFQALARDKLLPFISLFGKGHGKGDDPKEGYILSALIALALCMIGNLDAISALISNFFLLSYGICNYACFDGSLAKSPGWRPAFKYYSMWLSLVGALLCLAFMFVIDYISAIITIVVAVAVFVFIHYKGPDVNWGDSGQAHLYQNALKYTRKLTTTPGHIKNYRPQILLLSGFPGDRLALTNFVSSFAKKTSLVICGDIIKDVKLERLKATDERTEEAYRRLAEIKMKAFYVPFYSKNFCSGTRALLQCCGLGKLRPNILMVGLKTHWQDADPHDVEDYFRIVHDAFDVNYAVGILRLQEIEPMTPYQHTDLKTPSSVVDSSQKSAHLDNGAENGYTNVAFDGGEGPDSNKPEGDEVSAPPSSKKRFATFSKKLVITPKPEKRNIDVWWLFDDGGLTILLPYLLSKKKAWRHCCLRIFLTDGKQDDDSKEATDKQTEIRQMETFLSNFRLEFSSIEIITDFEDPPRESSTKEFEQMIIPWLLNETAGERIETHPWKISKDLLEKMELKTRRQIRTRELLLEYSREAELIVCTLPIPRIGMCSAGLYMAWLETLTKDMPPILLLRGNQESIITYYS